MINRAIVAVELLSELSQLPQQAQWSFFFNFISSYYLFFFYFFEILYNEQRAFHACVIT